MRRSAPVLALVLLLAPPLARAQVETDGSLGSAGLVPGGLLPDGTFATYRIDESLGQRRGGSLFHSFSRFGVPVGSSAAFTADLPTERVLARVSGTAASVISGRLISTIPGADLYLMNPYGVIFSAGSSLDVRGSFYVSSGDYLRHTDGERYSALPSEGETLSAAPPSAWGFLETQSPQVTIRGCNPCAVPAGETFSAVGGAFVDVRNQITPALIKAPGGTIQLGARLAPGEVPLDLRELNAREAAPGELGAVRIGPVATLDVSDQLGDAPARGRIVVRAGSVAINNASLFASSPRGAQAGDVDIDLEASDSIAVAATSGVFASTVGEQSGGMLRLSAASVSLAEGSRVETLASGGGDAGDIEIEADVVNLSSAALLASTAHVDGRRGGTIRIRGGALEIVGGAQVSGTTLETGAAGDIDIEMTDRVRLSGIAPTGPSGLFARSGLDVGSPATGAAGEIRVTAPRVAVEDGAEVSAQSFGTGAGGRIRIEAGEGVRVASVTDRTASINSAATSADGGDIEIATAELVVANGGVISATTLGVGDAGDVRIQAPRLVVGGGERGEAGDAGIFAQSLGDFIGRGGDIELDVSDSAEVLDGAEISVSTRGGGDAGTIRFLGTDRVLLRGGELRGVTLGDGAGGTVSLGVGQLELEGGTITTQALGSGRGGEIAIDVVRDMVMRGAAHVGATTSAAGNAGDVTARVGGALELGGASRISTQSSTELGNGGPAGDVSLAAREVRLLDGSEITSATSSSGNAGTIAIASQRVRVESGSRITTQTTALDAPSFPAGDGGAIEIRATGDVTLSGGSAVTAASSGNGDAGTIRIEAGRIGIGSGSSVTSETALDGPGGDITLIAARAVDVSGDGRISASSTGSGNAGSIAVDAGDELVLRDGGRITTQAAAAFGGNIDLRARELVYVRDAEITTSVDQGAGNGGNITIDPKFVVLDDGRIEARANAGNGGNITIRADHFLADVDSVVDASSQLGVDGQIQITAPETDLSGELAQLSSDYLDPSSQLSRACAARSGGQGTFNVAVGARATSPDAPLESADAAPATPACEPR